MYPTIWDPFRELEQLMERYNRSSEKHPRKQDNSLFRADWAPSVDVKESANGFDLRAELPGVSKEDVHVSVENGVLSIRGEKKNGKRRKGRKAPPHRKHVWFFYAKLYAPAGR